MHLKLNTGMNRLGIRPEDAERVLTKLLDKGALVEGVMSHFSSADEDLEYSEKQFGIFKDCVKSLNYDFKYIHMCASDASIKIHDDISTHCRVGLGLIGFSEYPCDIKPCVSLYSEVMMFKRKFLVLILKNISQWIIGIIWYYQIFVLQKILVL